MVPILARKSHSYYVHSLIVVEEIETINIYENTLTLKTDYYKFPSCFDALTDWKTLKAYVKQYAFPSLPTSLLTKRPGDGTVMTAFKASVLRYHENGTRPSRQEHIAE